MKKKFQQKIKIITPQKEILKVNKVEKLFSFDWFFLFLFFLTTLIVYSNSFDVPFHFDDEQQIVYNESSHSFQNFTHLSYCLNVNNRPVSAFTLVANFILNGDNVFGYHVVNFFIHLLSGIILYFLLQLIIKRKENGLNHKLLPAVITLFFLIHPVQTQSVTYIIQRMTSLAGMFFLLSVFLYTKGRIVYFSDNKTIRAFVYYILAAIAGIMGVFSKQNAVVFPLAFLLLELLFIRNKDGKVCKRYLIIASTLGFVLLMGYLIKFGLPYETKEITRLEYLATQMIVIPRYFQMMLIPIGLSIDHGVQVVKSFFDLKVLFGASFLIGILIFAFSQIKKLPLVSFGIFWIFISMIIESSIFPIRDVMFDHRMYLPLVGFSIAMWALIFDIIARKKPKLLSPIIFLVLIAMSVGTFARNDVWRSRVEIWEKVTELYPDHFRGWQGLGRGYVASGEKDISKIIRCYERALQIEPDNQSVLNDLAANYMKMNKTTQAISCFKKLEDSDNPEYKINSLRTLGYIYLSLKEFDLSSKYLKKVIKINSEDTTALQSLSNLYIQIGDFNTAIQYSAKTLKVLPDDPYSLFNIGYSYINIGRSDLAKQYLIKLLRKKPSDTRVLVLLANANINTGNFDEAIFYLKKAHEILKDDNLLLDIDKIAKMKQR